MLRGMNLMDSSLFWQGFVAAALLALLVDVAIGGIQAARQTAP